MTDLPPCGNVPCLSQQRLLITFEINPFRDVKPCAGAEKRPAISCEKEPRRHLACQVRAEGLDDRVDTLPALPNEEHAHVVHAEAVLVDVGAEGRAVGNQLPQDERLLEP